MREQRSTNRFPWAVITCQAAFLVTLATAPVPLWAQFDDNSGVKSTSVVDSPTPHAVSLPRPVSLNLRQFEIPFSVDSAGLRPVEVQLHVSRSQGAQWELYASQPASGRKFLFTAQQDGVYWFATRTVDATRKAEFASPIEPQLIVNIDTENPRVEIKTDLKPDGKILVSLVCNDQSPSVDSLRIDYAVDQSRQWNAVNDVSGRSDPVEPNRFHAIAEFTPPESWQQISVRAFVGDLAGNKTIVNATVVKPRVAASDFRLAATKSVATVDAPTYPSVTAPAPLQLTGPIPTAEPGVASAWAVPQFAVSSGAAPATVPPASGSSAGPELAAPLPPGEPPAPAPALDAPTPQPRPKTAAAAMRPMGEADTVPSLPRQSTARVSPDQNAPTADVIDNRVDNRVGEPIGDGLVSAGVQIRYSNSRKFSLEYEIESAGLAGVSDVELWGTRDRGLTWKRWGSDPDRESPFDIETNNDGAYGFRIVVVANNGLATPRPIENDLPDIFVVVDTLSPSIRFTGAAYGEGNQTGALVMRYECTDMNLTQRPITLSFGPSQNGPWSTIAAGLENEGAYVWPADPNLPRQIYLRIDAIDLAGNLGSYILDTPIDIQGLAPRARIRGFNPLTGSPGGTRPVANDASNRPTSERPQTATQPQARFK